MCVRVCVCGEGGNSTAGFGILIDQKACDEETNASQSVEYKPGTVCRMFQVTITKTVDIAPI